MTTPLEQPQAIDLAPGGVDAFPVGFRFSSPTDVKVLLREGSVDHPQILNVDYVIVGADPLGSGGTIVFQAGRVPAAGVKVVRWRETPARQDDGFGDTETFRPKANERAFDDLTRMIQELRLSSGMALTAPVGEAGLTLPPVEDRAGRFLGFDAEGRAIPRSGVTVAAVAAADAPAQDETQWPLRLTTSGDERGLFGGFDPTRDIAVLQGSDPGEANKPLFIQPNGGVVALGAYSRAVLVTASLVQGDTTVTIDVSEDQPQIWRGSTITANAGWLSDGTTVADPVHWYPSYQPGSGGAFSTKTFELSAPALATGVAELLIVWSADKLDDEVWWLTNHPNVNGDGAFDVGARWVAARYAAVVRGPLRAEGADFSSYQDFEGGGTEGGYVAADGFTSRTVLEGGSPVRFAAFAPYGINMPMDAWKTLGSTLTRFDATLLGNVWSNVITVPVAKAAARQIANLGGPAFGDNNKLMHDGQGHELALFSGVHPGQNTVNDLPIRLGVRVFPYSVSHQLGQGSWQVHEAPYRAYRSRVVGVAYGEYHNHLIRSGDDGLTANGTTPATGTLVDLDFNRFTTVAASGHAVLIPAVPNAGPIEIVNEGSHPLTVVGFVRSLACTATAASPWLTGFGDLDGKHIVLRGMPISGAGLPAGVTVTTVPHDVIADVNGRVVLKMSANATATSTGARTFGGVDTINGASTFEIPPGHKGIFKVYANSPGQWRAELRSLQALKAGFRAYAGSDQTGIAGNAVVAFGTEVFDQGGVFNHTNGRITPPPGVRFRIEAQARIKSGHTAGALAYLMLKKNGVDTAMGAAGHAENGGAVTLGVTVIAAAGDYYEINFVGSGNPIVLDSYGRGCACEGWTA